MPALLTDELIRSAQPGSRFSAPTGAGWTVTASAGAAATGGRRKVLRDPKERKNPAKAATEKIVMPSGRVRDILDLIEAGAPEVHPAAGVVLALALHTHDMSRYRLMQYRLFRRLETLGVPTLAGATDWTAGPFAEAIRAELRAATEMLDREALSVPFIRYQLTGPEGLGFADAPDAPLRTAWERVGSWMVNNVADGQRLVGGFMARAKGLSLHLDGGALTAETIEEHLKDVVAEMEDELEDLAWERANAAALSAAAAGGLGDLDNLPGLESLEIPASGTAR
jgi:hypothetical protein